MARLTIKELQQGKGTRKRTQVFVRNPREAAACNEAGIELLVAAEMMGDTRTDLRAIRRDAPDCFITFGLPLRGLVNADEVLREAYRLVEMGADAVYCPYRMEIVETLAAEYIPVVGHVGFVPLRSSWYGGFRAVGTNAADALDVWAQTKRYQSAGAIAVEMEVVPREVAAAICANTPMLVIGLGAGAGCDVQYLFSTDVLGDNEGHVPRHAKVYRDFKTEYARLQRDAVAAFSELHDDVQSGAFPEPRHEVAMRPDELAAFLEAFEAGPR